MAPMPPTFNDVAVIARAIAVNHGLGPDDNAGKDLFLAALVKAVGPEEAGPLLVAAGFQNLQEILCRTTDVDVLSASGLPAIKPDADLRALLAGPLKGFREGTMSAIEALEVLLQGEKANHALAQSRGEDAVEEQLVACRPGLFDTKALVRNLTLVYQARYALGVQYGGRPSEQVFPDFVADPDNARLRSALREIHQKEISLWPDTFGSAAYEASPLGQVRREYGEIEAHLLGAVLLAEMNMVGGAQGLCVRHLGYILDPANSFRVLGKARRAVRTLQVAGLLETANCPGAGLHLSCMVLPSESIMDEWDEFLAGGSIGPDEIDDPLGVF